MKKSKTAQTSFFQYVDTHQDFFVDKLREIVALDGVSAEPERRPKLLEVVDWVQKHIEELGGVVTRVSVGEQTTEDGKKIPIPDVIFANFGLDPKKKTLLAYGHMDVQPAYKSDGWSTEPFELTEIAGKLYGRGATDDKGPLISWLWVVKAYKELGLDLPVNLKLCLEGMEEMGSIGLDEVVHKEAAPGGLIDDVDYVCISDNYWISKSKPCVTYGLRGNMYFFLEVEGSTKDLHSGVHGGAVNEPMIDVVHLMSKLVAPNGKILVPGLQEMVQPMDEAERKSYDAADFNLDEYKVDTGIVGGKLLHDTKQEILIHRWREPCLSLHGVQGDWSGAGAKTVIPRKVIGKFSLRIVPDMECDAVEQAVVSFMDDCIKKHGSPNKIKCYLAKKGGRAWLGDVTHPNFKAARAAQKEVWGVEPDLTREGGSIPITITFEEATGKSVVLLPVGASDDGAHSQNEKIDRKNYLNAIKVLGTYLEKLAELDN